jgi:hypothetical protein
VAGKTGTSGVHDLLPSGVEVRLGDNRVLISCISQPFPSGSANEAKEP